MNTPQGPNTNPPELAKHDYEAELQTFAHILCEKKPDIDIADELRLYRNTCPWNMELPSAMGFIRALTEGGKLTEQEQHELRSEVHTYRMNHMRAQPPQNETEYEAPATIPFPQRDTQRDSPESPEAQNKRQLLQAIAWLRKYNFINDRDVTHYLAELEKNGFVVRLERFVDELVNIQKIDEFDRSAVLGELHEMTDADIQRILETPPPLTNEQLLLRTVEILEQKGLFNSDYADQHRKALKKNNYQMSIREYLNGLITHEKFSLKDVESVRNQLIREQSGTATPENTRTQTRAQVADSLNTTQVADSALNQDVVPAHPQPPPSISAAARAKIVAESQARKKRELARMLQIMVHRNPLTDEQARAYEAALELWGDDTTPELYFELLVSGNLITKDEADSVLAEVRQHELRGGQRTRQASLSLETRQEELLGMIQVMYENHYCTLSEAKAYRKGLIKIAFNTRPEAFLNLLVSRRKITRKSAASILEYMQKVKDWMRSEAIKKEHDGAFQVEPDTNNGGNTQAQAPLAQPTTPQSIRSDGEFTV